MLTTEIDKVAHVFFAELQDEVVRQAEQINIRGDGSIQDGFSIQNIADGWLKYKGMSWGFALRHDPMSITFTFGPDGPFVGYQQFLLPKTTRERTIWVEQGGEERIFTSAQMLAKYGIERLAAKAHDDLSLLLQDSAN